MTYTVSSGPLRVSGAVLHETQDIPTPNRQHRSPVHQLRVHWRAEWAWIAALLVIAAVAHGVNMLHYPYFEDDEGTYMSQAWAVATLGRLAPYTYWYDHAPGGWIAIAGWTLITGGFHTFGTTLASGRVFMLVLQIASVFMVYRIARNVSGSVLIATTATLLFALSPYGIYYHRRVLLDNIATFWMLLGIVLLLSRRLTLNRVWLSALAIGFGILSKEIVVVVVPALAYLVHVRAHRTQRMFAAPGWLVLIGSVVSVYILMAVLKGELFPTGTLLGGTQPHVSLLGTLQFQAGRGKDGGILSQQRFFWYLAAKWVRADPMLVVIGSLCALISALTVLRHPRSPSAILGIASLSLWAFLGRGGEVIDFYLVPLLPLLALNIALTVGFLTRRVRGYFRSGRGIRRIPGKALGLVLVMLCMVGTGAGYVVSAQGVPARAMLLWTGAEADAQVQAITWIETHLPVNSAMIIDQSMYTDLHDGADGAHSFVNAHYYWKVEDDPAIRDGVFHNNWRNVNYVVTTNQMLYDARANNMTLVNGALAHSTLITRFDTNGWPIEVRQVNAIVNGAANQRARTTPYSPASRIALDAYMTDDCVALRRSTSQCERVRHLPAQCQRECRQRPPTASAPAARGEIATPSTPSPH